MNDLEKYYKESLLANLCGEYKGYWQAASHDKEKLVRLAMQQQSLPHLITFANDGKGLTKDYVLQEFGDYVNGNYTGIDVDGVTGDYKTELYVGFKGDLSLSNDVTAFMWATVPTLEINPFKATKMYVGAKSDVHIVCGGYNHVVVMLFDTSTVWLDDIDEESSVTIYQYSDKAKVEVGRFCLSTKIKCFRKELRL